MPCTKEQYIAWGAEGGKKRAKRLSKRKRSKIAALAARARWEKKRNAELKQES